MYSKTKILIYDIILISVRHIYTVLKLTCVLKKTPAIKAYMDSQYSLEHVTFKVSPLPTDQSLIRSLSLISLFIQ